MGDQLIILDTNFFYAFYNANDNDHQRARTIYSEILDGQYGKPILLDYVFDELATLVQSRSNSNKKATELGSIVMRDTEDILQFIMINQLLFKQAWQLFQNQTGRKPLSFTDCVIIATALELNIKHVASFESEFLSFKKQINIIQ
ncbi:MAG: type II toxin-antitoxin system VapC family toxin [Candidatus Heimdallarchaeota archaeon]|nr:type II toxin-antitoxin system VapC family toxin [Candidatus Heimdallarchaeota archaeon]